MGRSGHLGMRTEGTRRGHSAPTRIHPARLARDGHKVTRSAFGRRLFAVDDWLSNVAYSKYVLGSCLPSFFAAAANFNHPFTQRSSLIAMGARLHFLCRSPRSTSPCNFVKAGGTASPIISLTFVCPSFFNASPHLKSRGNVCSNAHSSGLSRRFCVGCIV